LAFYVAVLAGFYVDLYPDLIPGIDFLDFIPPNKTGLA